MSSYANGSKPHKLTISTINVYILARCNFLIKISRTPSCKPSACVVPVTSCNQDGRRSMNCSALGLSSSRPSTSGPSSTPAFNVLSPGILADSVHKAVPQFPQKYNIGSIPRSAQLFGSPLSTFKSSDGTTAFKLKALLVIFRHRVQWQSAVLMILVIVSLQLPQTQLAEYIVIVLLSRNSKACLSSLHSSERLISSKQCGRIQPRSYKVLAFRAK